MIKGLIFDLDGTLLNTLPSIAGAVNRALKDMGLKQRSELEVASFIYGGEQNLVDMALQPVTDIQLRKEALALFRTYYKADLFSKTEPYTGVLSLLRILRNQGFPVAILSNKPDHYTQPIVQEFFPGYPFVHVLGSKEPELKKPVATTSLLIARKMRIVPSKILFVGDTLTDLRTARNAKMRSALVAWGFRSPIILQAYYPEHFLKKPLHLLNLLKLKKD